MTEQLEEQVVQQESIVPVEIMFHISACRVERIAPGFLELSLISPTGIAVTVRMSQDNADELAADLLPATDSPKVDVFSSMPGLPK